MKKKIILLIQIILTLFGTGLAFVLFIRALKAPSLLGILGAVTFLVTYLFLIIYTLENYNKEDNKYFKYVIYAYASVLGVQILQSGNYMSDYGLTQNVAILINCFNLIAFANIIKFADNLNSEKIALAYMIIAVLLKLTVEISLIIKMLKFIQLIHIFMSLSIPILGITIIIAYIYRIKRMKA